MIIELLKRDKDFTGNFISVDGVKIYYEIYGKGAPLLLIHGNGGNIAYMKPQIEYFAKKYKVIAMDCRGRGISKANLCIFTGENHYVTKNNPDLFNSTVAKFFNDSFLEKNLKLPNVYSSNKTNHENKHTAFYGLCISHRVVRTKKTISRS